MAEGHAKLSLRHEVSIYDALAAIKLYEENMTLHSGYSLIIQNESPTDNDEVVSSTCIYLHLQNSEVSQFSSFLPFPEGFLSISSFESILPLGKNSIFNVIDTSSWLVSSPFAFERAIHK